jgi:hypothetical protein
MSLVGVSQSASLLSFGGISQSISSVPGAAISGSGSSFAALTLPRMTSSLMPSGDNHRPTTLSFSRVDESEHNEENYDDTNVDESTLDDDQTDVQESNNDADLDYTQQHDFMQEDYTNNQLAISDNVISNGTTPQEWEDIPPDIIMATVKKLKHKILEGKGLRPFYKSYNSWEKMIAEQRDKAIACFHRLPANAQGLYLIFILFFSFANLFLIPLIPFLTAVAVLHQSRADATNAAYEITTASSNNTKDDITRLIHL